MLNTLAYKVKYFTRATIAARKLAYSYLLLQLKNRVIKPNLTHILVNSVETNLLNNQVLTMIGSSVAWEGGLGPTGRLQEVGINHIDYETCSDLYDGDIVDCSVPGGGQNSCQGDSGGPISIGKARGRKD